MYTRFFILLCCLSITMANYAMDANQLSTKLNELMKGHNTNPYAFKIPDAIRTEVREFASHGHPLAMQNFLSDAVTNGKFEEAWKWYCRLKILAELDANCITDLKILGEWPEFVWQFEKYVYETQQKQKFAEPNEQAKTEVYDKQIKWITKKFEEKKLVNSAWVIEIAELMGKRDVTKEKSLIPEEFWNKTREAKLEELKKSNKQ